MCGIAGFANTQPGKGGSGILERMTGAIRHRGPDDNGFFRDDQHPTEGPIRTLGVPVRFSRTPAAIERLAPALPVEPPDVTAV